ncbi:MAG TPA: prepilin peptidase [Candidatus Cybelea sp.]|jgi:prepilin peptidase CpaA|nr:prepilin peptidase [Candidatus Cybelea sp.]
MSITIWLALAACCVAGVYDVRTRRIPNVLTASLAATAAIVHAFYGWQSLAISLLVMAALMLAGAIVYARGGIGGGDVKLAVAASGMLSYPLFVPFLLYSAIGGGLLAIFFLAFKGDARAAFSRVALIAAGDVPSIAARRTTLPYAVAFAIGALAVALSQSIAPFLRILS